MKDYITKDFLRAELSEFRMEMRAGFSEIRAEFRDLRTEMSQLSGNMIDQIDRMALIVILSVLIPVVAMMLVLYYKI